VVWDLAKNSFLGGSRMTAFGPQRQIEIVGLKSGTDIIGIEVDRL